MLWTRKNIVCVCQLQKWTINVMNWKKCFNVLTVSITHWAIEVACATKAANFVLPICIATIPHRTWRRGGTYNKRHVSGHSRNRTVFPPFLFPSPPWNKSTTQIQDLLKAKVELQNKNVRGSHPEFRSRLCLHNSNEYWDGKRTTGEKKNVPNTSDENRV